MELSVLVPGQQPGADEQLHGCGGRDVPLSGRRAVGPSGRTRSTILAGGWDALQHVLRVLRGLAQSRGVSIANLTARYILEQPAVGAIIVGARLGESEHTEETERLSRFARQASPVAAIAWRSKRKRSCPRDGPRPAARRASAAQLVLRCSLDRLRSCALG
ncbi:MAG: hypothetical protein GY711_14850 [bacterium]|nr:hypothetical protein [bacterium]